MEVLNLLNKYLLVKYEVNKTVLCFVLLWHIQIILVHGWIPLAPLGLIPGPLPLVGVGGATVNGGCNTEGVVSMLPG